MPLDVDRRHMNTHNSDILKKGDAYTQKYWDKWFSDCKTQLKY